MADQKLDFRLKIVGIVLITIIGSTVILLQNQKVVSSYSRANSLISISSVVVKQNSESTNVVKPATDQPLTSKDSFETKQQSENYNKIKPEPTKVSDQSTAPLINQIKTDKRVIFLGIDDGQVTSPEALKFFQDHK